jgi:hypothetical protein
MWKELSWTSSSADMLIENFLPNIDGVTRCLTRLLEHLRNEGHECILLGPESGMDSYLGFEVVGTWGIPLVSLDSFLAFDLGEGLKIRVSYREYIRT